MNGYVLQRISVPLLLRPVIATKPKSNKAAGNQSAPPGWILERGPVDPKPLKLGIYGTVPRNCVGGVAPV